MKLPALLAVLLAAAPAWAETVVIVNLQHAGTKLTAEQIGKAYLGHKITLPDGSVLTPINQTEGGALRDTFLPKITGKTNAQFKAIWSRAAFSGTGNPPREVGSDVEVKKIVADTPGAFGYIDKHSVDNSTATAFTD